MILSDYAVKRRTTVFVLMFLCTITGVFAYLTLPREAAPDIAIPFVMVMTVNRGVGPADIESTITRHMEEELEGLDDLKKMISISGEGISHIILEFESGVEIEDALRKVKDQVDRAKGDLPREAFDPVVQEINASEFPIMIVNVYGTLDKDRTKNLMGLRKVADDLKDVFEMVPGVLAVKRVGGLTPEVRIEVDPDLLAAYRIPPALLVARYLGEDVKISAGSTDFGDQAFDIRVPMEFERNITSAKNIIIHKMGERAVYLGDLAEIVAGFEDEDTSSRFNGQESVALVVQKKTGENILHTAAGIKYVMEEARRSGKIPKGVEIAVTSDVSEFIEAIVVDLDNNIFTGFFLVLIVVLFSLGIRSSIFVSLAIPFSFLISLTVLMLMGITLNFVVLFALILALGMLVDNAIVIVENIYRHQQMGHDPVQAAILGTKEVAWPITTSTLTTLAAFAPMLAWPGIMGEFFSYLPLTLIVCLTSSLFVALVINPAVCAAFMRVKKGHVWGEEGRRLGLILRAYQRILRTALRWKLTTGVLSFASLFAVIALYGKMNLGVEFVPPTDPQNASVDITFPEGIRLGRTKELALQLEERIRALENSDDVEFISTAIGTRGVTEIFGSANASNISRIAMEFRDMDERKGNSADFVESIRKEFADVAGAEIRVKKEEMGPPSGDPVNLEIHGSDYKILGELAAKLKNIVREVPGVVDVRDDYEPGRPELVITVDRKRAALLGLSPLEAGMTIQTAYRGTKVGVIRSGDEEYDVNVIAAEKERDGFGMLDKLYLATPTGGLVPASTVAEWNIEGGQGSIKKIDRDLVVSITADVEKGFQKEAVRQQVKAAMTTFEANLPTSYFVTLTGEQEMMAEAQQFLFKAFFVAVFLIAIILISQFNSIRLPLIILSSLLLSLVGVFVGLIVLQSPFIVMMTGIGVISLAGVVVNNAIVLVDYINKLREQGIPAFEAVVNAGVTRLRPVMLTAITTICGLVPMAIGVSFDFHSFEIAMGKEMAQFWAPMAWAVIFGLAVATILTLIVVPALYAILMRVKPAPAGGPLPEPGPDPFYGGPPEDDSPQPPEPQWEAPEPALIPLDPPAPLPEPAPSAPEPPPAIEPAPEPPPPTEQGPGPDSLHDRGGMDGRTSPFPPPDFTLPEEE